MSQTDAKPTSTPSKLVDGYSFIFLQSTSGKKNKENYLLQHKYRFKSSNGQVYIVDVEEYKFKVFVMKFYLKNHAQSDHRYSYVAPTKKRLSKNKKLGPKPVYAGRVFTTCLNILKKVSVENPGASFGIQGAPRTNEDTMCDTQRYRVYSYLAKNYFSPENFEHLFNIEKSTYLLLNKANKTKELKKKIEDMFNSCYNDVFEIH